MKIRIIPTKQKQECPVLEVEVFDQEAKCCDKLIADLSTLTYCQADLVFVVFIDPVKPSIVAITIGYLEKIYNNIAVREAGWDCYIVASTRNQIGSTFFRIGQILH